MKLAKSVIIITVREMKWKIHGATELLRCNLSNGYIKNEHFSQNRIIEIIKFLFRLVIMSWKFKFEKDSIICHKMRRKC